MDDAPARPPWWTSASGGAGWIASVGMAAGVVLWWPLAALSAGGWLAVAMIGYRRSAIAMRYLQHAFPGATHTSLNELRGTLEERLFIVRNNVDTLNVRVGTRLPTGITIDRNRPRQPVGDPAFDAELRVIGEDADHELAWRVMLTADLRTALRTKFAGLSVELCGGWFDFVIDDEAADGPAIEQLVRDCVALGEQLHARFDAALPDVLGHLAREPVAAVRRNHFAFLVANGHEVPAVLHLAARDVDPEICAWAQSQRPSETLYR